MATNKKQDNKQAQEKAPKTKAPGFWSKFGNAIGEAIGNAKFGS